MLDGQDIVKLKSVFVTKQDFSEYQDKMPTIFATKQELQEVRNDLADLKELMQGLIVSVDKLAKAVNNLAIEYVAISNKLSRLEYR